MKYDGPNTLVGSPIVVAPGKIFLAGEYAVLEGGPAVVAAVSRYAMGQYIPDAEPASALVAETVRRATIALGGLGAAVPPGSVRVDSSMFKQNGQKLGLGSSAAAAVATAAAVFENAGLQIEDHRDLLFSVADTAHRSTQGGLGSGADVAASTHGGFIRFVREATGRASITPLSAPAGLHLVVFWTGSEASTPSLIQSVRDFAERHTGTHHHLMADLRAVAEAFATAFAENDVRATITAAQEFGRGLAELGAAAACPIVTPAFAAAATLASALGGAAKPSGAGGGDVGVAFFADAEAAVAFAARCPQGLSVLDVRIDHRGAREGLSGLSDSSSKGTSPHV